MAHELGHATLHFFAITRLKKRVELLWDDMKSEEEFCYILSDLYLQFWNHHYKHFPETK